MEAQGRTEMKDYERKKLGPKPRFGPHSSEAIRMCVNAWHQLEGSRHIGYGVVGAIPFESLVAWADVNRLDRETFELLCIVIAYLDGERAASDASKRVLAKKGKKQ
jgi:hypothetical protein